jgi:hypothetical protein
MRDVRIDERLPCAVTWTVINEPMERSSHALASEGRVWLIDPVDDERALAAAEALGEITAVLQLLDRHPRHCARLASRYGVPHIRLPERLDDSPFEIAKAVSVPRWREVALWWEAESLLVVAEAFGTASYFALDRPLGVHPWLRMRPPRSLSRFAPTRLLVGHGDPLHEDAAAAISEALARSRRDAPRAFLTGVRAFMPGR